MKRSGASKSNSITGDALPVPALADEASLRTLRGHTGLLSRAWGWLQARQLARSGTRRLRVAETVSLGEKRFVAVVQVDGRHFLLAGGPSNIVLLAQLDTREPFQDVLKKTLTAPGKQAAKRKRPAHLARQAQANRTTRPEDVAQKTATAPGKQPAKQAGKQNGFEQRPASGPVATHLNGAANFSELLHKSMSGARQPGNHSRKQNSKSTTEQIGYYA
jgi:flagellar biogenesis protein FliO